jgi:hypothetical protein
MVVKVLSLIVTSFDLNQNCKHWLFKDALQFIITKACEFHDDIVNLVVLNNMGYLETNVFDAKLVSQPHFEGVVRSPLTLPKMGLGSPP